MKYENINVELEGAVKASLSIYIQENNSEISGDRKRPMVIICPGGGYEHLSPREGEPVAFQFIASGCNAAVLNYDVESDGMEHPLALMELAWATAHVRSHAKEYVIDPDKILIAGFSAGGHLAASLGCFWDKDWLSDKMGMDVNCYKPNGLILCYPVITSGKYAHRASFERLMGSKASQELEELLSLEKQVTDNVPPVFMWHTNEDTAVPLENTLLFAEALRKAGVSLEYHVFPHGFHGLALATEESSMPDKSTQEPQCEYWMILCKNWIKFCCL